MHVTFSKVSGIDIRFDVSLHEVTTFKLGGPCACLITCAKPEDVREVIRDLADKKTDYVFMGGGSNILVSDRGYDGVVVRYVSEAPSVRLCDRTVEVTGSTLLDDLVRLTIDRGLDGLVCCTGIPGTVGGAIVGNAGAWGKQIGDALTSVKLMDRIGRIREEGPDALRFAYRRSALQQSDDIVLSAQFALVPGKRDLLMAEREKVLALRAQKHPALSREPCIGSFFRNIESTSAAERRRAAGWFLEQAGAKTLRVGGAYVFHKHANIIIKGAGCTAQDVYDLSRMMRETVCEKFGLELIREVRFLGVFKGQAKMNNRSFY